jgi:hypothetical protein
MTNRIVDAIRKLESKGAPIASIFYTDGEGNQARRDIQIGCKLNFTGARAWGTKVSKAVVEHNGKWYIEAVDRNNALRLRKENPTMGVKEAARKSIRSYRADRIGDVQYGDKILA